MQGIHESRTFLLQLSESARKLFKCMMPFDESIFANDLHDVYIPKLVSSGVIDSKVASLFHSVKNHLIESGWAWEIDIGKGLSIHPFLTVTGKQLLFADHEFWGRLRPVVVDFADSYGEGIMLLLKKNDASSIAKASFLGERRFTFLLEAFRWSLEEGMYTNIFNSVHRYIEEIATKPTKERFFSIIDFHLTDSKVTPQSPGMKYLFATVAWQKGVFLGNGDNWVFSLKEIEKAAELYKQLGCDFETAGAYASIGSVLAGKGRFRDAIKFYYIALDYVELARVQLENGVSFQPNELPVNRNHVRLGAEIMTSLASAYLYSEDFENSKIFALSARQICEEENLNLLGAALEILAEVEMESGNLQLALDGFLHVLQLQYEAGQVRYIANLHFQAANCYVHFYLENKEFDKRALAIEQFQKGITFALDMGQQLQYAIGMHNLGRFLCLIDELEEGEIYLLRALKAYQNSDYEYGIANVCHNLGWLALQYEDWPTAKSYSQIAYEYYKSRGDHESLKLVLINLHAIALKLGDQDLAGFHAQEADALPATKMKSSQIIHIEVEDDDSAPL